MTRIVYPSALPYPFSMAIRAGDFVFVSGQLPLDSEGRIVEGSIEVQARKALENLAAALEEAGCGLEDVVKNTIWLQDARDFGGFNRVYSEFFPNDPPTRSTVGAQLMLDVRIEIECVAYKPLEA